MYRVKRINFPHVFRSRRWCVLFLGLLTSYAPEIARTQEVPGVDEQKVLIGSCAALEGPARFLGQQTVLGATAYLHYVNDRGGVNGRKVNLLAFDDGYEPEKAESCYKRLVKEGVFSMGFFQGTPTSARYVPLAEQGKIPVVGLFTGAQVLQRPNQRYIFHVRASYFDESREMVTKLWEQLGIHKIAVIYQSDLFGNNFLEGVKVALQKYHAVPTGVGSYARNTTDVSRALEEVRTGNPQAVIVAGVYAPTTAILKQAHAQGWRPLFLTGSFVGTEELMRQAGSDAEGMIITQVLPPYDRRDLPTIALYHECVAKYYSSAPETFISLEGFVDAMVVVEGLKRAGPDLTREKFVNALESIHHLDMGLGPKLTLDYNSSKRRGFDVVYDTVVRGGRAELFTDWKTVANPQ